MGGTESDVVAQLRDELKLSNEQIQTLQQKIQEFNQIQADADKPSRKNEVKGGVVKIIEPYCLFARTVPVRDRRGHPSYSSSSTATVPGHSQGHASKSRENAIRP